MAPTTNRLSASRSAVGRVEVVETVLLSGTSVVDTMRVKKTVEEYRKAVELLQKQKKHKKKKKKRTSKTNTAAKVKGEVVVASVHLPSDNASVERASTTRSTHATSKAPAIKVDATDATPKKKPSSKTASSDVGSEPSHSSALKTAVSNERPTTIKPKKKKKKKTVVKTVASTQAAKKKKKKKKSATKKATTDASTATATTTTKKKNKKKKKKKPPTNKDQSKLLQVATHDSFRLVRSQQKPTPRMRKVDSVSSVKLADALPFHQSNVVLRSEGEAAEQNSHAVEQPSQILEQPPQAPEQPPPQTQDQDQYWDDPMLEQGFDIHDGSGPLFVDLSTKKAPILEADNSSSTDVESDRRSLQESIEKVQNQPCEWDFWWDWYFSSEDAGDADAAYLDEIDVPVSVCNITTMNTILLEMDGEMNPTHLQPTDSVPELKRMLFKADDASVDDDSSVTSKKSVRWSEEDLLQFSDGSSLSLLDQELPSHSYSDEGFEYLDEAEDDNDDDEPTHVDPNSRFVRWAEDLYCEIENELDDENDSKLPNVPTCSSLSDLVSEADQLPIKSDAKRLSAVNPKHDDSASEEAEQPKQRQWAKKQSQLRRSPPELSSFRVLKPSKKPSDFDEAVAKLQSEPIKSSKNGYEKQKSNLKKMFRRVSNGSLFGRHRRGSLVSI